MLLLLLHDGGQLLPQNIHLFLETCDRLLKAAFVAYNRSVVPRKLGMGGLEGSGAASGGIQARREVFDRKGGSRDSAGGSCWKSRRHGAN